MQESNWTCRTQENPLVSVIIPCLGDYIEYLPIALESVYAQTFDNFEVIVNNTPNVSLARNEAISKAKSPFILCLDADDYLDSDFLEKTVGKGEIVATGWRHFENETGETIPKKRTLASFLEHNHIIVSSVFKKSIWEHIGGFRDMGYEDWDFWVRALKEGYEIKIIEEVLVNVRKHKGRNEESKLNHENLKAIICG